MLQFVKQIKTLVHSKPTLYFGHLSCEETSQNELQPSGVDGEGGVLLLYDEGRDVALRVRYMILKSLRT